MKLPIIETAVGLVNGSSSTFYTSYQYVPGSLRVWINGLVSRAQDADGWTELGGKKFRMKETPRVGDVLRVYYLPL